MTTGSGDFAGLDGAQTGMPAVGVTKLGLTLEEESHTFFAQATMGVPRGNVTAIASVNLSDVPSPTTVVTDSGPLFVKNARVHVSLSTRSLGSLGK